MNALTVYLPPEARLPDNATWENRIEIHSETSDRVYTIAQHRERRHWGCTCPAWRRWRHCKHLLTLGLPAYEQPKEIEVRHG